MKGYERDGLLREIREDSIRHVTVNTRDIAVYSLIREEKERDRNGNIATAFCFYKITRESIEAVGKGTAQHTKSKMVFPEATMSDMLKISRFRSISMHGIFISGISGNRLIGFTQRGLNQLCAKAMINQKLADKRSNNRDFMLAEAMLKGDTCTFAVRETKGGEFLICGVFGENYRPLKDADILKICGNLETLSKNSAKELHMTGWHKSEDIIEIEMEYRNRVFKVDGREYIPGIKLIDSQTGRSAFRMQATIRSADTGSYLVIGEKKLRHDAKYDMRDTAVRWKSEIDEKIGEYILAQQRVRGVKKNYAIEMFETSGLEKIVGKKRMERFRDDAVRNTFDEKYTSMLSFNFWAQDYFSDEKEGGIGSEQKEKLRKELGMLA